jgi:hypothetical protein
MGLLPKFTIPMIWQAMILASIWFTTKTSKLSHLACQIYGNVFAQLLAFQIFSIANFGCQPSRPEVA